MARFRQLSRHQNDSYVDSATVEPLAVSWLGPCTLNGVQYPTCSTTSNSDARRRLNLQYPGIGNQYGDIPRIAADGNANYNALLVAVQRTAKGVTINANYTLSHCIS